MIDVVYNLESLDYDRITVFEHMKVILLFGNSIEAENAMKLMLQFSFNSSLCYFMDNDKIFKASTKRAASHCSNRQLVKYCDGLAWRLSHIKEKKRNSTSSLAPFTEIINPYYYKFKNLSRLKSKKVFISHDNYDSLRCKAIQSELRLTGLQVCLNTEDWLNANEKIFENIATVIQSSDIIIICKYMLLNYKI